MRQQNQTIVKALVMLNTVVFFLFFSPLAYADQTSTTALNNPSGLGSSLNWAGYVATGGGYTSVSGNWVVPQVTASTNPNADATWVGIGGVTTSDLIQMGTQAINTGSGSVTYQAWYEMLPNNSVPVSISVNPGDLISASINQVGTNQWLLNLRDNTNSQNFQTTVTYASSLTSAEWIQEMPSSTNGFIPLDDFGTIQFSSGQTIQNGVVKNILQSGAQTMTMMNKSNQAVATVSGLNSDGASFSVTRTQFSPDISSAIGNFRTHGFHRSGLGVSGFQPGTQPKNFGYRFRNRGFTIRMMFYR